MWPSFTIDSKKINVFQLFNGCKQHNHTILKYLCIITPRILFILKYNLSLKYLLLYTYTKNYKSFSCNHIYPIYHKKNENKTIKLSSQMLRESNATNLNANFTRMDNTQSLVGVNCDVMHLVDFLITVIFRW